MSGPTHVERRRRTHVSLPRQEVVGGKANYFRGAMQILRNCGTPDRVSRHHAMSHNTFGHLFRVTTWGESHGAAIGCVVDGCPPGITLTESDIQHWLDRRKPGQSRFVTQRREPDEVKILSGV